MSEKTSLTGGVIVVISILVLSFFVLCICAISNGIENMFNDDMRNDDNIQNEEEIINNEVRRSDKKIPLYKLDDSIVEI
tara:strand:+ start:582 stop:818 length:237 start_codon:yes stop_codon:yes gene_type:complete